MQIAVNIASKSPVGVQMTKRSIIYSRDHTVQEGLDHIVSKQALYIYFHEQLVLIKRLILYLKPKFFLQFNKLIF